MLQWLLSRAKEPLYKLNQQAIIVAFTTLKSLKIQHVLEKYQDEKLYTEIEIKKFLEHNDLKNFKFKVKDNIKTAMLVGAFMMESLELQAVLLFQMMLVNLIIFMMITYCVGIMSFGTLKNFSQC